MLTAFMAALRGWGRGGEVLGPGSETASAELRVKTVGQSIEFAGFQIKFNQIKL